MPLQKLKLSDVHPIPLNLLTQRQKKCKTCTKIIVKPKKNPFESTTDNITFLLRTIVPKLTIYRFERYQEGKPVMVQIKFLNNNDSPAKVILNQMENDDDLAKITSQVELPMD